MKAVHLEGQVGVDVRHEVSQLPGILHRQQEVEVGRHDDGCVDTHRYLGLSATEDASGKVVQGRVRAQEELGDCAVLTVTSTSEPRSGMKRTRLAMPRIKNGKGMSNVISEWH